MYKINLVLFLLFLILFSGCDNPLGKQEVMVEALTPLHEKFYHSVSIEEIESYMIENNIDLSKQADYSYSLLLVAIVYANEEHVDLLCRYGADANPSHQSMSPLAYAVLTRKTEVIEVLLYHGADPFQKVGSDESVMWYAEKYHPDMVPYLVSPQLEEPPEVTH